VLTFALEPRSAFELSRDLSFDFPTFVKPPALAATNDPYSFRREAVPLMKKLAAPNNGLTKVGRSAYLCFRTSISF
jgi:hypothetical protein